MDFFQHTLHPQARHQKNLSPQKYWFSNVTKWIPKHKMSSLMVGKTWSLVSYSWFFGPSNLKHCRVTNWNWKIFFFSRHTYKPKEASFTIRKLRKIDFVNKNWPSDPKVGCKPPSNLVELIQTNLGFEEELEKFEGSFE